MTRAQGRWFDAAFVVAAIVAVLFWLGMASGNTILLDEWRFVLSADDWSFDELMRPLNSHWSLGLAILWKSLMATVGLTSYMPYVLVANLLHVAAAAGIYVYARRQTLPVVALGAGVIFLFFGAGLINFVHGLQMNFNLASAAGVWALVILMREPRPKHAWFAAVLLFVAVSSNGVGLGFPAAALAIVVLSRRHWRWWWVPLPAIVAFGLWYLTYGIENQVPLPSLLALAQYVIAGVGNAFGQVAGLGQDVGLVIAVLVTIAAFANLISPEWLRLGLVAGVVGLFALYVVIGLGKAGVQPDSFPAGRFVDVAAVFCLIAIIGLLGHRRLAPPREGQRVVLAVVAIVVVSLVWNIGRAFNGEGIWRDRADYTRAAFTLMEEFGGSPAVPGDRGFGYLPGWIAAPVEEGQREWLPSPDRYAELVERYGSPLTDPLAPWNTEVPDEVLDDLFSQVAVPSLTVGPIGSTGEPLPLEVANSRDVVTTPTGDCLILEVDGQQQFVDLVGPADAQLSVMSDTGGLGILNVAIRGTFAGEPIPVELAAGETVYVDLPDVGEGKTMQVRFEPPLQGLTLLCLREGDEQPPASEA